MKKLSFLNSKKIVTSVKKNFVSMKMRKVNLNYNKKLEIIDILPRNLEELVIVFSI